MDPNYCEECEKLKGCKACLECQNEKDDVCNDCPYDVKYCKWYKED